MGLSEKQSGRLFFPTVERDFDYKGFTVTDERSHRFVKDLYEYYWESVDEDARASAGFSASGMNRSSSA